MARYLLTFHALAYHLALRRCFRRNRNTPHLTGVAPHVRAARCWAWRGFVHGNVGHVLARRIFLGASHLNTRPLLAPVARISMLRSKPIMIIECEDRP